MALKKKWHFILTQTDGSRLLNLSLSRPAGIAVSMLICVLAVMMLFSVAFVTRYHIYFPQIEKIQAENSILRFELDKLTVEMDSVMYRLKQMEDWEDKLRLDRNIDIINRELRQMGTGGLPQLRADYLEIDNSLSLDLNHLWVRMDELKGISSFAYELRKELVDNISLQEEMYKYTPSIYPAYGRITSAYGWRTHPVTGRRDFHSGLDIANRQGSPIYVTADGTIKEAGYNRFYGRYIIVTHKFGYETMYGHLSRTLYKKGDQISRGEIIGLMGSTGRSTGSHLHYEVRRYSRTLNPYHYLNKMEEDIIITQK